MAIKAGDFALNENSGMEYRFAPDFLNLLVETISRLNRSKKDFTASVFYILWLPVMSAIRQKPHKGESGKSAASRECG